MRLEYPFVDVPDEDVAILSHDQEGHGKLCDAVAVKPNLLQWIILPLEFGLCAALGCNREIQLPEDSQLLHSRRLCIRGVLKSILKTRTNLFDRLGRYILTNAFYARR